MFLHYNITTFPGHFQNMVKKLEEANGGEGRRYLADSGELVYSPGHLVLHTVTYHAATCRTPVSEVCQHCLRQRALSETQHCCHCFRKGICTPIPTEETCFCFCFVKEGDGLADSWIIYYKASSTKESFSVMPV